ncbi:MAG: SDR family NAD(P)-dependent oxidoreductase [Planctomycetes bacterium]|nr:SDR family NAD(P)-dependent oxidoreductase [Planctomycetota bacterium]
MPSRLSGTAVVVGASSGIGAALATALAHEARPVALVARRGDELAKLVAAINHEVGTTRAHAYVQDVTDATTVDAVIERIERELGPIEELHYTAGVMPEVALDEYPTDKDAKMFAVNTLGCIAWCNALAPRMVARGRGHVVGVTSVAGVRGRMDRPGYNASKAGQDAYLEALRNRIWRKGVWVTTVRSGPVHTPMTKGLAMRMPITAEQSARGILRARDRRSAVAYVPMRWWPIMTVIRAIPSVLFRRMKV